MSVWRLTIEKDNGQCVTLCGSEEILRLEIDEWTQYEAECAEEWAETESLGEEYREPKQFYVRKIEGFSADAARTPVTIAYRFRDVVGMALVQL